MKINAVFDVSDFLPTDQYNTQTLSLSPPPHTT